MNTRVFQGVQQPVCIVIASRTAGNDPDVPARVRYTALPEGPRAKKFEALAALGLDGDAWADATDDWRAPFLPAATGAWAGFPALDDLFLYDGTGVMAGRTWIVAPDVDSLRRRWQRLTAEKDPDRKETLFHPHEGGDRTLTKGDRTKGIPGHTPAPRPWERTRATWSRRRATGSARSTASTSSPTNGSSTARTPRYGRGTRGNRCT